MASSDQNGESDTLSRASACADFVGITATDEEVARKFLCKNDWILERALEDYFDQTIAVDDSPETSKTSPEKKPSTECIDLTGESPTTSKDPSEESEELSLISWNVDGLDLENLAERARGLCSFLVLYHPDVVFLQELIPGYVDYLKKRAVSYHIIQGGEDCYFTGIMLKKTRVKLVESEIVNFQTSQMRNLLVAQATYKGQKLCLMTSHLESCKDQAALRMKQLSLVMQRMTNAPGDVTVVFGGDTNLRDAEVAKVGLPANVLDVWEKLGKPEHCRYTWDTKINSNKNARYVSRCRFDRVYLRPATEESVPHLGPSHMTVLGVEPLDCRRYISDHWGLYCCFAPV
ncbi:tyrosyl-DNA phosphodiesterase 2 [Synchiropus splendidus]|uniref:tyrosyl-DNA phosphodiesterase 2 n=1 Tax=Synchiropus splendidus TaxID=270530 RepID=UPI00237DAB1B|nr:tyrosyl-DNA phosphodiesterase 2 [Synchiropus splendidus]